MDAHSMQRTPGEQPWLNQQPIHSDASSEVDVEQDRDSSVTMGEDLARTDTRGGYGERRGNAVNIETAVHDYEELRREMTQQSRRMSMSQGEKGGANDFDLNDYLTEAKAKNDEAGINRKNLGLIWRNLTVKVSLTAAQIFFNRRSHIWRGKIPYLTIKNFFLTHFVVIYYNFF